MRARRAERELVALTWVGERSLSRRRSSRALELALFAGSEYLVISRPLWGRNSFNRVLEGANPQSSKRVERHEGGFVSFSFPEAASWQDSLQSRYFGGGWNSVQILLNRGENPLGESTGPVCEKEGEGHGSRFTARGAGALGSKPGCPRPWRTEGWMEQNAALLLWSSTHSARE